MADGLRQVARRVVAILDVAEPDELSLEKLYRMPVEWEEQRRVVGVAAGRVVSSHVGDAARRSYWTTGAPLVRPTTWGSTESPKASRNSR
jgi:hypothetical protein